METVQKTTITRDWSKESSGNEEENRDKNNVAHTEKSKNQQTNTTSMTDEASIDVDMNTNQNISDDNTTTTNGSMSMDELLQKVKTRKPNKQTMK